MLRILPLLALMLSIVPAGAKAAYSLDATPTLHSVGEIEAMTTGDVNGDGVDEVIVATSYSDLGLWIFSRAGQGLGTPRRLSSFPSVSFPKLLKTADFDGNGSEEILLVDTGRRVFRISVGPTNRARTSRIENVQATNADIADFDGDGHLDVLIADSAAGGLMLFGDGSGGFPRRVPINLPAFTVTVPLSTVGDLNGDGAMDYVFVTDAAYVHLNNGNGSFSAPVVIQPNFDRRIGSVAVGDFNNDGLDDLVLGRLANSPTMIKTYWQSNGALLYVGETPTRDLPEKTAVGDLDGDGGDDLALVHVGWGRIGLYMSTSSATLPTELLYTLPFVSSGDDVRISDVTGDGCKDVVASRNGEVAVFRGHGCQPSGDLRLSGSISDQGINIRADNLGAEGPLLDVVVDIEVSSRSGVLSAMPLPAECNLVDVAYRITKLRCQLDSIGASSGNNWFIPYTVAKATPYNRITLWAIGRTATQERTLDNNWVRRSLALGTGAQSISRQAKTPQIRGATP